MKQNTLEEEIKDCQWMLGSYAYFRTRGKQIGGAKVDYCELDCDCEYKGELVYVEVKPCVFYQYPICKAKQVKE